MMDTAKPHQNAAAGFRVGRGGRPQSRDRRVPSRASSAIRPQPSADHGVAGRRSGDSSPRRSAKRWPAGSRASGLHYCASPEEALRSARMKTRATVILEDLVMPGTDGLNPRAPSTGQNPATRDIPDHRVVDQGRAAPVKSAAFARRRERLSGEAGRTRIELIARIPLPLAFVPEPDSTRRGVSGAAVQSQQQLLATNLELQRLTHSDKPDRPVESTLPRSISGRRMAGRSTREKTGPRVF